MAAAAPAIQSVQVFGRKKTATAVCHCRKGHGIVTINGVPVQALEPVALRAKVLEPLMILGTEKFQDLDLRVRSNGGGVVAQIYAIRQSIAKAIVAFYQKYVDESEKKLIKDQLLAYDRSLLTTDSRRREPKKFGGPGARARFQKAYR